jgi:hypothetical protein
MTTITQSISAITPSDPTTMTRAQFSAAAPTTINDIVDMVTELNTFAAQANALAAGLNAIATGAALAIPLTFSTTTTDSDPGNGILRLDNATQNTATTVRTDLIGNDGSTWTDVIALFDDSTSTVKGFITLVDTDDATKWLVFSVASLATPGGYVNITVTCVASSAANPFADGASLALKFTRTGDKGDTGATGTGITAQATGFTATGGTTPKTLTMDEDVTASSLAQVAASQGEMEAGTEVALRTMSPLRVAQAFAALGVSGYVYTYKDANFNAVAGNSYLVDTSAGAITATLPATPALGDALVFFDAKGTFGSNNLTIARNGHNYLDETGTSVADDLILNIDGIQITQFYESPNWRLA